MGQFNLAMEHHWLVVSVERLLAEHRKSDPSFNPAYISAAQLRTRRSGNWPSCVLDPVCPSCNAWVPLWAPSVASPSHLWAVTSSTASSQAAQFLQVWMWQQQLVLWGWHLPEPTADEQGDKAGSAPLLGACHTLHRAVTGYWMPESLCEARDGTICPRTAWGARLAESILRTGSFLM